MIAVALTVFVMLGNVVTQ